MSRVAYVNGRYLPHARARVHVEDRGYQFADGVYEVIAVRGGRLVDAEPHFERLDRSLSELDMRRPMSRAALAVVIGETLRRNRVRDGIVYLQVSRGAAPRDHAFPGPGVRPALVLTAKSVPRAAGDARAEQGVRVVTMPDIRWRRCDIKSVSLLPNVLAKQRAKEGGGFEAWQVDDAGYVTEGSSTNAWIVDGDGNLVTRQTDGAILFGITRLALMELARREGIRVIERPFTVGEAQAAREAFITSTTSFVMPVVQIDDKVVGNGVPGSISRALRDLYDRHADGSGGAPSNDD